MGEPIEPPPDEDPVPDLSDLKIMEYPAHGGAQTTANRGPGQIDMVIMHTSEGNPSSSYGPAHWFADPRSKASAHYNVYSTGTIYRSVPDKDVAWHAGNWSVNQRSLGIEIQAQAAKANWNEAQLLQAARLVAALSKRYGIPIDRDHIKGHVEVSGPGGHTDPGPHWPWDRFMGMVKQIARGGTLGTLATALTLTPLGIPVWAWGIGLGVAAVSIGAIMGSDARPPRLT